MHLSIYVKLKNKNCCGTMDFILLFVALIFTDGGTLTDFVLNDLERYGYPDGQKRQKREATGLCL